MSDSNQFNFTPNDLVGVLIHDCNRAAAHLAASGVQTDWIAMCDHFDRMSDVSRRVRVAVEVLMSQHAAMSADGSGANHAQTN